MIKRQLTGIIYFFKLAVLFNGLIDKYPRYSQYQLPKFGVNIARFSSIEKDILSSSVRVLKDYLSNFQSSEELVRIHSAPSHSCLENS